MVPRLDKFHTGQLELVLTLELMHFKPVVTLNSHADRLENGSYFEFPIITTKGIYRWKSYIRRKKMNIRCMRL